MAIGLGEIIRDLHIQRCWACILKISPHQQSRAGLVDSRLTAAHKTLPLGSVIRVTNTQNGQSVVLRVNDRGPYAHGRVLDVSHEAAKVLGMEHSGTASVRIEVL